LRASGARLADLRLKRPSLEDVYLQLIQDDGSSRQFTASVQSGGSN
jgi:hypothetical protein